MELLSIKRLSELTGKTREEIVKKLLGVPFEDGPKNSKTYPSRVALERIYLGGTDGVEDGEAVTEAESRRRLNIKRGAEIDLDMEIKRKQRIPLPVCEEINDRTFANMAGMLKSWEGRTLSAEHVNDLLTELRSVGQGLLEFRGKTE